MKYKRYKRLKYLRSKVQLRDMIANEENPGRKEYLLIEKWGIKRLVRCCLDYEATLFNGYSFYTHNRFDRMRSYMSGIDKLNRVICYHYFK